MALGVVNNDRPEGIDRDFPGNVEPIDSSAIVLAWCDVEIDGVIVRIATGGLKWSSQHFILDGRDGVDGDGPRNCSRFQCGGESGVVGSLAARGIAEGDWTSVWQAVIVDLFSGGPLWWNSSGTASSFAIGIDAFGARGDIPRYRGGPIDALDGQVSGPLALDGEPRNRAQWRL